MTDLLPKLIDFVAGPPLIFLKRKYPVLWKSEFKYGHPVLILILTKLQCKKVMFGLLYFDGMS